VDAAAVPDAPDRALEGRLEDLPLCDILQILQVSGKTGGLFLTHADGRAAVVVFRNGRIVQVTGTDNYQPLGERLEQRNVITKAQLDQASTYMGSFPGMRLGDALVELSFVTRGRVEAEVKAMMAESVHTLMSWGQGQFEFRVGVLWTGSEGPDANDFVLEEGVEPQRIIVDLAERKSLEDTAPVAPRLTKTQEEQAEEEVQALLVSLQEARSPITTEPGEPEAVRAARKFLSLSEELFSVQGRGEIGLVLLRYASELYSDGALVHCQPTGFKVLGQFGSPLVWGAGVYEPGRTFFTKAEVPILEVVRTAAKPYAGLLRRTDRGAIVPASKGTAGVVAALMIPMTVLGSVTLILVCRTAVAGAPDARALVALARQVALSFENLALRDSLQRKGHATGTPHRTEKAV
jgi:Domain of unknown function (DUF4388)